MNIGIITHPVISNYGGLIQNYALQVVLKEMGHDVYTIDHLPNTPFHIKALSFGRRCLLRAMGKKVKLRVWQTQKEQDAIYKETRGFVKKYIATTQSVRTKSDVKEIQQRYNFDAYIVGSDQVWRNNSIRGNDLEFLSFVEDNKKVKKIAYAASFGVSTWEYNEENTKKYKRLIQKFDAVSVREDSAVDLLRNYLHRADGVHVLDPTMLLSIDKYIELVEKEAVAKSPGSLKAYILDHTPNKMQLAEAVAQQLELKIFEVMPKSDMKTREFTIHNVSDFVFPNPAAWIRGYMDAEFVVTDSFHGTVFSILFNKPFIAIGNPGRGMTRFNSLLRMFDLQDRLVTDPNAIDVTEFLTTSIDWDKVNGILNVERARAIKFLRDSLG